MSLKDKEHIIISLIISKNQYKYICKLSKVRGVSKSKILRQILNDYLTGNVRDVSKLKNKLVKL